MITAYASLRVGRCAGDESVKKWDFGTSWYWSKMKILTMLSSSVKTKCLKIFLFSGNLGKRNQGKLKMCLDLDLGQFASFAVEC